MNSQLIKKINRYFHDQEANFFSERHAERIEEQSIFYKNFFESFLNHKFSNLKILDIGSGTGLVAKIFEGKAGHQFVCADISIEMIKKVKSVLDSKNNGIFNFVICDAEKLPFKEGVFDIVICNAAMHHFPSSLDVTKEIDLVLSDKGMALIGFEPNRKFWKNPALSIPYRIISRFNKQKIREALDYGGLCAKVNSLLIKDRLISEPLDKSAMLECVDIHSPNAGNKIDYSKGFDIDELVKNYFSNYDAKIFHHYKTENGLFNSYNRFLFPEAAPQFSLILRKKAKRKIKVLYFFMHLNYGGAEVGLLTTLKNIDRNKFDCSVICIEKKGPIGEEIERMGFRVIYLNSKTSLFNLSLIKKVSDILREERPDIFHTSLFYANFFGRLAAIRRKIKIVITEERSMYIEKRFYHVILDNILSHMTDKIIACSRSVIDFTVRQEKIPEDKFHLIYNAVDSTRFNVSESKDEIRKRYGFSEKDFIVGSVGSVIPKKGHKFLIKACQDLVESMPNLKLVIIGEGESRKELELLAQTLKIPQKVLFLGPKKEIPELMKIMDVFVLPSLQEGFPRTLIEAMYVGIPSIASRISGIPEIIRDGENGLLVEPGDSSAISRKLLFLYRDPDFRNRLGLNARKTIESGYLSKDYLKSLEDLYLRLYEKKNLLSSLLL